MAINTAVGIQSTGASPSSADIASYAFTRDPRMAAGTLGQTYDPTMPFVQNSADSNVSGTMYLTPIVLTRGDTITNISFVSQTQAAVAPTHWWFALYNSSRTLLAQTADQTSTAWAATTVKTVALQTPQLLTYSGKYFVAFMMTAGTIISHHATGYSTASLQTFWNRTGASDAGLLATAPGTAAAPSNFANAGMYAYVS